MERTLKFRRRKKDRPQEIIEAAIEVFSENGFAATRLSDIATRAGVTRGTLYLYFDSKEALFEAVVRTFAGSAVAGLCTFVKDFQGSFAELLPQLPDAAMVRIANTRIPSIAKLVIGEAGNFPDLAKVWRSEVLTPVMKAFSHRVRIPQEAGEVRPGPPELYAMSITAPVILGLLFREVFGQTFASSPMLSSLTQLHGQTLAEGMLIRDKR